MKDMATHYKETAFPALTYTYAAVLSTVCIFVYTGIAHFQRTHGGKWFLSQ